MPTVRLLKNGVEVYPAMLAAIDGASAFIALEMYIYTDDAAGREFRDRLAAAARRGVEVRVLVDALGSWTLGDSFWDQMRDAGALVRWFRPIRRGLLPFRDHRKILLVDDHRAFVGGLNIGDEYHRGARGEPPWRDNALELAGSEVVALRMSFLRMWERAEKPLRLRLFENDGRRQAPHVALQQDGSAVRVLESGPEDPFQPVRRAYGRLIRRSQRSIDLAMSYFYPPGRVLRALRSAVRRGVRVRLLFPARSDVAVARWAARGLYGRLLRSGMEVWEYQPAMLHSKLAIVDDTVVTGSANLDIRSGRINYELVAAVDDRELADKARRDFDEDLRSSESVHLDAWNERPLLQKLKERVSYWLLARADLFVARTRLARLRW
jgi:cardiolipin synthase